jgi:outer membrane protein OmpA-like peptidoglycan-associated protein
MSNSKFRSSTSLVLSLSMAVGPAWSQETAPICDPAAPQLPCTLDGTLIESADALSGAIGAEVEAQAAGEAEIAVEEEAPAEEVSAEEALAEEVIAEEAPVVEEAPVEEAVAEEAPAEEVVAEETPVVEEAPAEEAVVEEVPAEEAVVEEAPTEEVVAEEAPAKEAVVEETLTQDVAAEEAPAEEVTQEAVVEEAPAEEAPTAEMAEEAPAAEVTPAAPPTPEETVQETSTAAAASDSEVEGEITTETVVEGDVRTADEDFETAATGDVAASSGNNNRGLSNFEKALLVGLGAVAIGSILSNGDEVVSNSGDRVVLQGTDGQLRVLKDDDVLLRQPGSDVRTETFNDGSTRTFVTRADGSEVVTIRAADGRVLRRALIQVDGSQIELFDDTREERAIDVSTLPRAAIPTRPASSTFTEAQLRAALAAEMAVPLDRTFSLRQVRSIREVRELSPVIELSAITFPSGSAAIQPDQSRELAILGTAIKDLIVERPGEVFLIEGHTDAVGPAGYNLALSDRRAETVALALTQYFDVPPANLVTQGYGESLLKVQTLEAEQANRRATVRNITQLLR